MVVLGDFNAVLDGVLDGQNPQAMRFGTGHDELRDWAQDLVLILAFVKLGAEMSALARCFYEGFYCKSATVIFSAKPSGMCCPYYS